MLQAARIGILVAAFLVGIMKDIMWDITHEEEEPMSGEVIFSIAGLAAMCFVFWRMTRTNK